MGAKIAKMIMMVNKMTLKLKHLYCRIGQARKGKMDELHPVLFCETNQCYCHEPQNGNLCLECFEIVKALKINPEYLDVATHLNDDMMPLCGYQHSEGKGCVLTPLRSNVTCPKCREEIRKNDAEEVNSPYAEQQRRYERNDPNEV